jgi:acyl dehydratase
MSDLLGAVVDRVASDVERGKIREFARATLANDPAHTDREFAERSGLADVLATSTHVVVSGHYRDQRELVARLGMELSRVVGSVSWRYQRPLVAGDQLRGLRQVAGDEVRHGRRGGAMRLVTLRTEFIDFSGEVAVTQEVLIERSPA